MDGPELKPCYVRCERAGCPWYNTGPTFSDGEVAMRRWNPRAQLPPPTAERAAIVSAFARKDLIRGELICFELDRTGVLQSDKVVFSPWSTPLMKRPSD